MSIRFHQEKNKLRDIDTSQWWKKAGTPYFVGENHGFFLKCSPKSIVIHVKLRWVSMLAETLQSTIPHLAWLMIFCWDGKSHEISMFINKIRFTLNFAWWIQLPLELRKPNAINLWFCEWLMIHHSMDCKDYSLFTIMHQALLGLPWVPTWNSSPPFFQAKSFIVASALLDKSTTAEEAIRVLVSNMGGYKVVPPQLCVLAYNPHEL